MVLKMNRPQLTRDEYRKEYEELRDAGATYSEALEQVALSNEVSVEYVMSIEDFVA
jgi:hypothetical protein